MALYLGSTSLSELHLGGTEISAAYIGASRIWPVDSTPASFIPNEAELVLDLDGTIASSLGQTVGLNTNVWIDQEGDYNGISSGATVVTGEGYSFVGGVDSGDTIDVDGSIVIGAASSACTLETWFKTSASHNDTSVIMESTAGSSSVTGIGVYQYSGQDKIGLSWLNGDEQHAFDHTEKMNSDDDTPFDFKNNGGPDLNNGEWHHLIVSYSGDPSDNFYIQLDGVRYDLDGDETVMLKNWDRDLQLGRGHNTGSDGWTGTIGRVRVWTDSLSPTDMQKLWTDSRADYGYDTTPSDHFGVITYDGPFASNSSTESGAITGLDFTPDMIWIKNRDQSLHWYQLDSVRGADSILHSSSNSAEIIATDASGGLSSFDDGGFTLDNGINFDNFGNASDEYVAYCWKAGGAAVSNTDGTTTSSVSANTDAGFSIVSFSKPTNLPGNNGTGTVGHGLDKAPELIITKATDDATNWWIPTDALLGTADSSMALNQNWANDTTNYGPWGRATDTVFTWEDSFMNHQGNPFIAYCFHSVPGYSQVGTYTGNGAYNKISIPFRPQFVLIKRATGGNANNWLIFDAKRNNGRNPVFPDISNAEQDYSTANLISGFESDGFHFDVASNALNANGSTYIFYAIAADPVVAPTDYLLHYDFNDSSNVSGTTVNDLSGNGYNGTLKQASTYDSTNGYLDFDVTDANDYVTLTQANSPFPSSASNLDNTIKSISGWGRIVPNSNTAQNTRIYFYGIANTTNANEPYTAMSVRENGQVLWIASDNIGVTNRLVAVATGNHTTTDWNFYVCQLNEDEDGLEIYVNGESLDIAYTTQGTATNGSWIDYAWDNETIRHEIGRIRNGGGTGNRERGSGDISKVTYWDRTLSKEEIQALYALSHK